MFVGSVSRQCKVALLGAAHSVAAAPTAVAQEVKLRFASFTGPTNFLNKCLSAAGFKKLEDGSSGKLKVAFLTGGFARPRDVFDSVEAGVGGISWSITSYCPGRYAAARVTELPLNRRGLPTIFPGGRAVPSSRSTLHGAADRLPGHLALAGGIVE